MLYNHLMPPKVQFSKEQILDTAFELVAEAGMAALSVRALAKRLGSSVAPIYVNFKNTGELMAALERKIIDVVWRYSTREYCTHGFFNIGIGQLLFVQGLPQALPRSGYQASGRQGIRRVGADGRYHGGR
jgi:AcrR family transcriptional regulator